MNPNKGQKWKEEFKARFREMHYSSERGLNEIEDFISSLLSTIESEIEGKKVSVKDLYPEADVMKPPSGRMAHAILEKERHNQGVEKSLSVVRSYRA